MTEIAKSVSNNVIDNYIQRVTEWSQSSQRIPTTEELENIAAELGIEAEEIQAAQKQSHDHYIRAQGYMRLKHWDDAIAGLARSSGL
jgi:DNA-directed RNA polymerase specialized sigma subunit